MDFPTLKKNMLSFLLIFFTIKTQKRLIFAMKILNYFKIGFLLIEFISANQQFCGYSENDDKVIDFKNKINLF